MQQETASQSERTQNLAINHQTLLSLVEGRDSGAATAIVPLTMGLSRILVDRRHGEAVPFEGDTGIEAVLEALSASWPTLARFEREDHLLGLRGDFALAGQGRVTLTVTLDAGGQVVCAVGPSAHVQDMLSVIEAFDRQLHVVTQSMGCDYELLAEGYNPYVSSPLDVSLVPRTRWTLLTAHLSQTGRYARDVMRCGCSTTVRIGGGTASDLMDRYRLASALAPIFMFLSDNVRSFRGLGARRTPRMARYVMWSEVDPTRCGIVPGTFDKNFGAESYVTWLERTQPILFVADDGSTTSTGKGTLAELMEERILSRAEASRLLRVVYPYARLVDGCVELTQADSLRPNLAAGYAAFVKGLLGSKLAVDSALSLVGNVSQKDVDEAALALHKHGWDASVYGQEVGPLVDQLVQISRTSLDDASERTLLGGISELWEARMVPRDSFVHQEQKERRGW